MKKYAQTVSMFVKNEHRLYLGNLARAPCGRGAGSEVVSSVLGRQQRTAQRPCPPGAYFLVGGRGENRGTIYKIYVGDAKFYRGR